MVSRIHQVEQLKTNIPGTVAMNLESNHHFPRHTHDQFGIGVIAFGAHRSWSGIGHVSGEAGDVIMVNPGEMHDGIPLEGAARGWRMIYFDPSVFTREVSEEFTGPLEIVRPVARDSLLARHFVALFACFTDTHRDCLAEEESLLGTLVCLLQRHGMRRPAAPGASPSVAKAVRRLDSAPESQVSLAELAALSGTTRFQLLRAFAREVGITPHAYLVQRRVLLAQRLLKDGQPPAQAALLAGFADQSHLTRAFVRQLGITPGRYRAALA